MSVIEQEFGVPIPGTVLPEDQWVRTAIKKLPPAGPLNWAEIFGRTGPVVLDIGCGNGRYTLGSAMSRPDHLHLASDALPVVIRYATRRANQRGLANTRFAVIGGLELLRDYVAAGSIAEIHVYHPQPYYEKREIRKRLVTPQFLLHVHQALVEGGLFVVQTDNPAYWKYLKSILSAFFEVREHPEPWPDAPLGRTRREILARKLKLPVFRAVCVPRAELTLVDLLELVQKLPPPVFNADRRLARVDRMERELEPKSTKSRAGTALPAKSSARKPNAKSSPKDSAKVSPKPFNKSSKKPSRPPR